MENEDLAKVGYEAYGEAVEWKNYQGLPMPRWDDLGEKIQRAWVAAATRIMDELITDFDQS